MKARVLHLYVFFFNLGKFYYFTNKTLLKLKLIKLNLVWNPHRKLWIKSILEQIPYFVKITVFYKKKNTWTKWKKIQNFTLFHNHVANYLNFVFFTVESTEFFENSVFFTKTRDSEKAFKKSLRSIPIFKKNNCIIVLLFWIVFKH